MARRNRDRGENLRLQIAQEAARIIAEQGIEDYLQAKRKAAERFGACDKAVLPKNAEIEAALDSHQRLFDRNKHNERLLLLRETARKTMLLFRQFHPRLVGSVLHGTATRHSDINLHLFADTTESVGFVLMERSISHRLGERRLRFFSDRVEMYPFYAFENGDIVIDATIFPIVGLRQAPCSPVDGRPMRRAALKEVQALLENT